MADVVAATNPAGPLFAAYLFVILFAIGIGVSTRGRKPPAGRLASVAVVVLALGYVIAQPCGGCGCRGMVLKGALGGCLGECEPRCREAIPAIVTIAHIVAVGFLAAAVTAILRSSPGIEPHATDREVGVRDPGTD